MVPPLQLALCPVWYSHPSLAIIVYVRNLRACILDLGINPAERDTLPNNPINTLATITTFFVASQLDLLKMIQRLGIHLLTLIENGTISSTSLRSSGSDTQPDGLRSYVHAVFHGVNPRHTAPYRSRSLCCWFSWISVILDLPIGTCEEEGYLYRQSPSVSSNSAFFSTWSRWMK